MNVTLPALLASYTAFAITGSLLTGSVPAKTSSSENTYFGYRLSRHAIAVEIQARVWTVEFSPPIILVRSCIYCL